MTEPNRLSACEARAQIAAGGLTSEALVRSCLERIQEREPDVGAWAYVDADAALAHARQRDAQSPRGPLHGLPVGVKDNIDASGMPAEYGSPIYRGHVPPWDAACVALAREAGAVVLGKTATTEFALRHPAQTRNPCNLAHSPGGSSSGSAAAVADFMVPFSFGTQTGGSQIRPASFCGIVGYKPTFGLINPTGVKPLSPSNDTAGVYGRSVPDAALLACAVSGLAMPAFGEIACRVGLCRTPQWEHAEAPMVDAFEDVAERLSKAGIEVTEVALPPMFDGLLEAQETVYKYEVHCSLAHERQTSPQLLSPELNDILQRAGGYDWIAYRRGQEVLSECRRSFSAILGEVEVDALMAPSAPGEAPRFEDGTGDAVFNKIWTGLHVPAVSIPLFVGPSGLPMGAQVVGDRFRDGEVLSIANHVMNAVG